MAFFKRVLGMILTFGAATAPPVTKCFVQTPIFRGVPRPCGGVLHKMSDLTGQVVSDDNLFGAQNLVDLIMSRGGIFDYDQQNLQKIHVCALHQNELGVGWTENPENRREKTAGSRRGLKCEIPQIPGFSKQEVYSHDTFAQKGTFVTKGQASALMNQKGILVKLGTAMCQKHKAFLNGLSCADAAAMETEEAADSGASGTSGAASARKSRPDTSLAESPIVHAHWRKAGQECEVVPPQVHQQTPRRQGAGDLSYDPSSGGTHASEESPLVRPNPRSDNVKQGIRTIAAALGIPSETVNFGKWKALANLASNYKSKKVSTATKVTDAVMSAFAPDAPDDLFNLVMHKKKGSWAVWKQSAEFREWIENVVDLCLQAPTRETRLQTLATLAPVVPYSELAKYLPGLTRYAYKEARRRARMMKAGIKEPKASTIREAYDPVKIETFIAFITSPMVVSDMPFGHATVRFSSGVKQEIPNLVRTTVNMRIINQYKEWLRDTDRSHLALSDSILWQVLKDCKAITRKSLLGLDYITYEGIEGVATLIDLVGRIHRVLGGDNTDWMKQTIRSLREVKIFLKTDYKTFIQLDSEFSDYSRKYALSDPNEPLLQAIPPNTSKRRCAICIAMMRTFSDIDSKIQSAWPNNANGEATKERLVAEYELEHSKAAIFEWQKHVMRTVNQQDGKDEIVQNLKGDEAWIIMDWAMKFIPKKGVESQTEWYGKRGISWHISVVFVKEPRSQQYYMRTFGHIFDPVAQDSETVIAIMQDVIVRLKAELPSLRKAFFRSDNAGCYHSAQIVAAIPQISQSTGVEIARYDFSDPQSGKGPCDRATSVIKRHVKIYVEENHKCSNPTEFFDCASSHGGVKTATFVHAGLDAPTEKTGRGSLAGITSLHNFEFATSTSGTTTTTRITGWNAYKIGVGKQLHVTKRTLPLPRLHPLHAASTDGHRHQHPLRSRNHWILLSEKSLPLQPTPEPVVEDDGWVPDETEHDSGIESGPVTETARSSDDEESEPMEGPSRKRLHPCTEEGCTKVYQSYYNWYKHVSVGKHTMKRERQTLRDFSIKTYVAKIQENQLYSTLPETLRAIRSQQDEEVADDDTLEKLPMGWALKVRRQSIRFSQDQKDYMTEKFDQGARTGRKWTPQDAAKEMRYDRRFPLKDQWLSWGQVASYWSVLARNREKRGPQQAGAAAASSSHQQSGVSAVDGPDEVDVEDINDDEHNNAYTEHIEESIQSVFDKIFGRPNTQQQTDTSESAPAT